MRYLIILFFCVILSSFFAQAPFYQDVFRGGVSCSGFMGANVGTLRIKIPDNSIVRKAFLICGNSFNDTIPHEIYLNGNSIMFNQSTRVSSNYNSSSLMNILNTHAFDITSYIDSNMDSLTIFSPQLSNNSFYYYQDFFLYIAYNNDLLPQIASSINTVDKDLESSIINSHTLISPLFNAPVVLSLLTGHMVDSHRDSSDVYLNDSIYLGRIGGHEQFCSDRSGVFGNFYYQNDTLYGLNDDTPDSLMNGADVLANISSYLSEESFSLTYKYQDPSDSFSDPTSNPICATFLTYNTKCETLKSRLAIEDTTVCAGEVLDLKISGEDSYTYAWRYRGEVVSTDTVLSIAPNENRLYSIFVSDTNGCGKTEIINIKVNPNPVMYTSVQSADCPQSNGVVVIDSVQGIAPPFRYQKENGVFQTAPVYANLPKGEHTIRVKDTNNCITSLPITINEVSSTLSDFNFETPLPFVPATINFTNQSENASEYQWFINGSLVSTSTDLSYLFESPGSYELALVASKANQECADTVVKTILLERENYLVVPTSWGKQNSLSLFSIGFVELEFRLLNSLGQVVHTLSKSIISEEEILIGNKNFAKGIYFYELSATKLSGEKVVLGGKVIRM